MNNLLNNLPAELPEEVFQDIVKTDHIRIERIISMGHRSREEGWYDQEEHEWVLVLSGEGTIEFEEGRVVQLGKGDCVNIPAHEKHRVSETSADEPTIWLAVFYR